MTVTGIITKILPETGGISKAGNHWRKQEAVVEYSHGQWPKTIVFQLMNDNIDKFALQLGQEYDLDLDFEAREWNGRYFLQASCWRATLRQQQQSQAPQPASQPTPQPAPQGWQSVYPQPQQYAPQPTPPAPATDNDPLPF